jgi:hypothetical protein
MVNVVHGEHAWVDAFAGAASSGAALEWPLLAG